MPVHGGAGDVEPGELEGAAKHGEDELAEGQGVGEAVADLIRSDQGHSNGNEKNLKDAQEFMSQSLNTDQGNSDVMSDTAPDSLTLLSQSLNTNQGNSDEIYCLDKCHPDDMSQSLNTNQGNSDVDLRRACDGEELSNRPANPIGGLFSKIHPGGGRWGSPDAYLNTDQGSSNPVDLPPRPSPDPLVSIPR